IPPELVATPEGFSRLAQTSRGWTAYLSEGPGYQTLARARCEYLGLVPTLVDLKSRANALRTVLDSHRQPGGQQTDCAAYLRDCAASDSMRNRARIRRIVRRIQELIPRALAE
ncbi:hypothetical protein HKX48_001791, partial [Thoreauomyces humboldtii]